MAIERYIQAIGTRVFRRTIQLDGWGMLRPPQTTEVTVEVDVDKIMSGLGNKALRNKSKRSRQFGVLVITKPVIKPAE